MSESRVDVVRAWKDVEYREGLGEDERAGLPECPAGMVALSDAELGGVGSLRSPTAEAPALRRPR
jgi:mersacidin/lichenicidin family type 2 lantibiotic